MISRLRKFYKNVIVDFDDEALRLLDDKLVDVIASCLRVIDAIRENQDREELETRLEASKLTAMAPWIVVEKDANGKQTGKTGDGASEIKLPMADYLSLSSFENRIGKVIENGALENRFNDELGKLLMSIDESVLSFD